jgi:hypothetical protein
MTPEQDHRKRLASSTARTACRSTSQAPSQLRDHRILTIQELGLNEAEVATLMQGTIKKAEPTTYTDGMAVLDALATELKLL